MPIIEYFYNRAKIFQNWPWLSIDENRAMQHLGSGREGGFLRRDWMGSLASQIASDIHCDQNTSFASTLEAFYNFSYSFCHFSTSHKLLFCVASSFCHTTSNLASSLFFAFNCMLYTYWLLVSNMHLE